MRAITACLVVASLGGCSSEAPHCKGDVDCTDSKYPYCDLDGEIAPEPGFCTQQPSDCPVDRCGCSAGAVTCVDGVLTECGADGMSAAVTNCTVGCEDTGRACKTFLPPNGLSTLLDASTTEPDVMLPTPITIDTDTGEVVGPSGTIAVTSSVLSQGNTSIRVMIAHSFAMTDVTVTGSRALAFVATDAITVDGLLHANAVGATPGPGGVVAPSSFVGSIAGRGGGGGGNATAGGKGGASQTSVGILAAIGGSKQSVFEPLIGGAAGGTIVDPDTNMPTPGAGGGGGAVELVSLATITIAQSGTIAVNGGGGGVSRGGGSGGNIVLAAPAIIVDGKLVANGGSGGTAASCNVAGLDGRFDGDPAVGAACAAGAAGSGGTGTIAPTNAGRVTGDEAGGGGAAGRVLVMNLDGMWAPGGFALISAKVVVEPIPIE